VDWICERTTNWFMLGILHKIVLHRPTVRSLLRARGAEENNRSRERNLLCR